MARFASFTMSMRDKDRREIIDGVTDGHFEASTAADQPVTQSAGTTLPRLRHRGAERLRG